MSLWHDVRFAARLLAKDRWFALVAVVTLGLGIAANNAVFTLVNAVLIRGLPFHEADRIMRLGTRDARDRNLGVSILDFQDWRREARTFSDLSLMGQPTFNVSEAGRAPERYAGAYVSANVFRLIGERALIGRALTPDDDIPGAPPVVVLGYGMWQARYGGDPSIIGRSLTVNELPSTVVGVMPQGMRFPPNTDLWLPLEQSTVIRGQGRQFRNYQVIGRLADGVTPEQARDELAAVAARLGEAFPETNVGLVPTVVAYNDQVNGGQIQTVFLALMGAVVFVLLIACANVSNLLLARAARRSKEVAVRVSLGATRWRLVRQLLVESVLLAGIAGLVSFPLSMAGIRLFDTATQNVGKPYWMEFTIDLRVYAYLAVVCLATGIIFGLAPALHVSKTNVNDILKEGGRSNAGGARARRWTSALLVVELALTLVLLAGAGFMMRSFLALYRLDLGIDTSRLVVMQLTLPDRRYATSDEKNAFIRRLDERLGAIGSIEAAAMATNWPLGGGPVRQLEIEGRPKPERPLNVTMLSVGLRYPETIGVPIVRGRTFTEDDATPGREGALVNQRLADLHFPGEDPVGRRIQLSQETPDGITTTAYAIVGLVPTVRQRNPQDPDPDPVVYVPFTSARGLAETTALIVRARSDPGTTTTVIREEIGALDADLPVFNIRTMDEVLAQARWPFRIFGAMFAIFAAVALALAVVGLYATTAYSVTQRTQEIGVRMALGAQPRDVVWLILRRTFLLLGIGLAIGLAGALGVGQVLRSFLVQTSSYDPVTLVSIALILLAASAAACVVPARRAADLDPLVALRYE